MTVKLCKNCRYVRLPDPGNVLPLCARAITETDWFNGGTVSYPKNAPIKIERAKSSLPDLCGPDAQHFSP